MGKRGPRPKPTNLRVLHGDKRSRINTREPQPARGRRPPAAPSDMSDEAKRVWRRYARELWQKSLLTELDRDSFRGYCEAVATRERAAYMLSAGVLVRSRDGGYVTNPAWRIYRDADAAVRRWSQEFGLTPSARSAIRLDEPGEDDLAAMLLS